MSNENSSTTAGEAKGIFRNNDGEGTRTSTLPRITDARPPRWCLTIFALTAGSLLLYLAFRLFPVFADWFNRTIAQALRAVMGILTAWLPLSLAECMLILSPLALIFLIYRAIRYHCGSWRQTRNYIFRILAVVCAFLIIFIWNFSAGYFTPTIDDSQKLNLERSQVSAEELYKTSLILVEKINSEVENIDFLDKDFSQMPYSREEMNRKLLKAYQNFSQKYTFLSTFPSRVKPVMLSEWMSYTHITGVYSYFTGEANLNVNFPDYTLPFTAAHELAHQRGIARENEANFVAFLVCTESEDPYIRYSGYLSLYEFVASALYRADWELYKQSYATLELQVRYEEYAYNQFYQKYQNSKLGSISNAVNDTYLKANGTEGTRSYGLVVDLAVAYYRDILS